MAKIFGGQSAYLVQKEKQKNRLSVIALSIVFFISGFGAAGTFFFLRKVYVSIDEKIYVFSFFAFVFFYTAAKLLYAYSKNELFAKHYQQGLQGEDAVFAELEKLSDDFSVFPDIVLKKGNIDFVVVSPNRIFCIEVKSHKGNITFQSGALLRNGFPFQERDVVAQTWRECKQLKEFMAYKLRQEMYIVSLLVFSNPETWVEVEPWKPVKLGVHVLHARMVKKFIEEYNRGKPLPLNTFAIREFLKPHLGVIRKK